MEETNERTPLHWAAMKGDFSKVVDLLSKGADPNTSDEDGWTPLITAAAAGYTYIVTTLIESGADPKAKTKEGRGAFFYACSKCFLPIMDYFLQNDLADWKPDKVGENALQRALICPRCNAEILNLFKRYEAPFDCVDSEGNTLMHRVCYEGRKDLSDWFLENTKLTLDGPMNNDKKVPKDLFPQVFDQTL